MEHNSILNIFTFRKIFRNWNYFSRKFNKIGGIMNKKIILWYLIFFITAALNQSKAYSTDLIVKLATNGLWVILLITVYPWLKKITKN